MSGVRSPYSSSHVEAQLLAFCQRNQVRCLLLGVPVSAEAERLTIGPSDSPVLMHKER